MAALVRAARFCRVLPSFISVRQQSKLCGPTKNLAFRALSTQAEAAAAQTPRVSPHKVSNVNRQMTTVETNLHRYGRISKNQLDGLLTEIEKAGEVNSSQALLALRAMGTMLFDEHPSTRVELVQRTWEKFENLGLDFEVTHYNALLRAYLQNKHHFSPSTFLETMENKKILPNRVTFQNLISQYCEIGDISGASQILEYMKELDLPIGEQVFNSLITGHFHANEPENAAGILDIMRKAGMEPSAETYVTLISGYIGKGQVEKIEEVLQMADNENALIRPFNLLRIIHELAIHNQKDSIPNMLTKLSAFSGINQDAITWINQLICQGHEDIAYQVFSVMPRPVNKDNDNMTMGRFFIRALVKSERPVESVCEFINKMRNQGVNKDTITFATHLALMNGKTDYALELIDKMESQGLPVRLHYYWPVLCQYADSGNKEGFQKALQTIYSTMGNEEGMVLTFHEYIIPGMLKLGYNYEDGSQMLKEIGYLENEINFAYFISLLETKDFKTALEFVNGKPMVIIMGALRPYLMRKYKDTQDWKSVIQVLSLSKSLLAPTNMLAELAGDFLASVVQTENWEVAEAALDEMIAQKINITSEFYQQVNNMTIPEAIQQKVSLLLEDSKKVQVNKIPIAEMNIAELTNLARTGNRSAKKWLIIRHCAVGNAEEAEKLKASLEAEGFLFPPIVLRQLFFLNALHKKDEQAAMEYFNQLQSQYPEYGDYTRALILLGAVLTENGKVSDVIGMLKSYAETHGNLMIEQKMSSSYAFEDDCSTLLKAVCAKEEPAVAKQVLQTLFDLGFIKPATYSLIEGMMTSYLERNNPDYCIEMLDWIITEYKRAPCIDGLLQMFIKAEDPEKLQKVMDLVIPIHGEMNLLHQLMVNLVECGHLKKARKILETPGLRAAMIRLRKGCENFINNNKITELEQLVEITKDMFAVDRDDMLFQLIRGYVKIGDYKKAQDVLMQYEEEGLSPSGRTLRYLGKAMKNEGLEISFDVPEVYNEKMEQALNIEDEILRHVQENRIRTAKDSIRKLEATDSGCPSNLLIKITEFLCKVNKQNDVGWIMQLLADKGDVENLLFLKAKNIVANTSILNKCLFTAYVNSNRTEELITHLEGHLETVGSFVSVRGLTAIANTQPDKLPPFEELADKCSLKNQRSILWPLWQTYFFQNPQCPKASAILQKQPEILQHMSVLGLCQKAVADKRMDVLNEMEQLFHQKIQTVKFIQGHIIHLHAKNNNVDGVLSEIEKLKGEDIEVVLRKQTKIDVEKLLTSNNKPIPWKQNKADAADSASSSDSSSDEETPVKDGSR